MKKYSLSCDQDQIVPEGHPDYVENYPQYVPAELAEKMLKVLKDLIQWEEIDQHSDDDMIAVLKHEAIINQAKSMIAKAEEE